MWNIRWKVWVDVCSDVEVAPQSASWLDNENTLVTHKKNVYLHYQRSVNTNTYVTYCHGAISVSRKYPALM